VVEVVGARQVARVEVPAAAASPVHVLLLLLLLLLLLRAVAGELQAVQLVQVLPVLVVVTARQPSLQQVRGQVRGPHGHPFVQQHQGEEGSRGVRVPRLSIVRSVPGAAPAL
jgi:hypothetical protein